MAVTYKLIETITVGSGGAASIEFTSIPQTYTDLQLVVSGRFLLSTNNFKIVFNGVTTGYSRRHLFGTGSSAGSGSASEGYAGQATSVGETASVFGNSLVYIPNYTGSTNKSYSSDGVMENNATASVGVLIAGLWSNTAAITTITLSDLAGSSSFVQYSSASLYGIKNS
jgi:hypothetical protein